MKKSLGITVALVALLLGASPAAAQSGPWKGPGDTDKMLGELKSLVDKGARENLARRSFIQDLQQLIGRYDWPWSRLLLQDSFADGNFTANPKWTVTSGNFEVNREFGLVSRQNQPAAQQGNQPGAAQGNVGQQLLGAVVQSLIQPQNQQQNQQSQAAATRSDIYTPFAITNGFDIRLTMRTRSEQDGRFEVGPYVSGSNDEGYRLVYAPGAQPSLALVRYSSFGSGVVEAAQQQVNLAANTDHHIQWLRTPDGNMSIFVNGDERIRTQDRTFTKGFDGIIASNLGGTHAIREIAVYGTQ